MNRWILIRHLKQILEYLTSSCASTIIIHLLMGEKSDFASVSSTFCLNVGTVPTVWYFFLSVFQFIAK
jgi:hypothetical protein